MAQPPNQFSPPLPALPGPAGATAGWWRRAMPYLACVAALLLPVWQVLGRVLTRTATGWFTLLALAGVAPFFLLLALGAVLVWVHALRERPPAAGRWASAVAPLCYAGWLLWPLTLADVGDDPATAVAAALQTWGLPERAVDALVPIAAVMALGGGVMLVVAAVIDVLVQWWRRRPPVTDQASRDRG